MIKERVKWIDISKGIGIMLIILAHVMSGNFYFSASIFSFIMPFFVLMSGITFECSNSFEKIIFQMKKLTKKLLLPTIIFCIIRLSYYGYIFRSFPFFLRLIIGLISVLLIPNGKDQVNELPGVYMLWFLLVLFFIKIIYDLVSFITKKRYMFIISLILSIIGVLLGNKRIYLPFLIDISFSLFIFFNLGQILKKRKLKYNLKNLFLSFTIWIIGMLIFFKFSIERFDVAIRTYPLFPFSYLIAIFGSFFLSYLGMVIEKIRYLDKVLSFVGKNSLWLLCIHSIEFIWFPVFSTITYEPG